MNTLTERTIVKPSSKLVKKLYAAYRHATVEPESGNLSFNKNFPLDDKLKAARDDLRFFYPSDRPTPIDHTFASDWTYMLAECLSEEPVIFLPRVWSSRVIRDYVQEYSFVEALDFIRRNPEFQIQHGWVIHRNAMWLFAEFHAAVRSPDGQLQLVQQTPGSPLERAVAFVPDNKNKLDLENNSSPALVGFCMMDKEDVVHIGTRKRVETKDWFVYPATSPIVVPRSSTLIKDGKAPHQPSETMDLIGNKSWDEIRRELKSAA